MRVDPGRHFDRGVPEQLLGELQIPVRNVDTRGGARHRIGSRSTEIPVQMTTVTARHRILRDSTDN